MSSANCEGVDVPVYVRKDEVFAPAACCKGTCLTCAEALCGVEDLAMGREDAKRDFDLRDYRRWSRNLEGRDG